MYEADVLILKAARSLALLWQPLIVNVFSELVEIENVLLEYLAKFHGNKAEFLRRFITMDKT